MFNIYKSNRIELVFEALASVLNEPSSDPIKPEWVGIQSRGMKQWVTIKLAQKFGVCANINFAFPKDVVNLILSECSGADDHEPAYMLDEDTLFWSILDQLFNLQTSEEFKTLQTYIEEDINGKKRFQLSSKIAKIFDDYQVYRPELLLKWQHQKLINSRENPTDLWQCSLWNQICEKHGDIHLASRIISFLNEFSPEAEFRKGLPERISFFGIFSLPPLFLQMLERISHLIDIHLFLLVPSNQFFLETTSQRRVQQISINEHSSKNNESLYFEMGNPLLTSLGTAGKEFLTSIEAFDYYEPSMDLFLDPLKKSQTMLSYLQSDILNMVWRQKGQGEKPVQISRNDTSISIHACHSPMREAQVLKDFLLHKFETDPDLSLHEVIVMMPDIEAYAPFIESVFSTEHTLGYSISDRRKISESVMFKAFFNILDLSHERLEKTPIIDLLMSEPVAMKFGISIDEIRLIQKMATKSNILWGRNAQHRKEMGLPAILQNTWEFGLHRLFMGMAMPQSYNNPVEGVLPCPAIEGIELEILGKFSAFCNQLFTCLDLLKGNKTTDEWCNTLNIIARSLFSSKNTFAEDFNFLAQTINTLKRNSDKAQFKAQISFDVIYSILESKLDLNISQGSFLSGKITFCNLMPMRSIPYKIVVLMGMDEKSFPRKTTNPGFDLIKTYPKLGDKNDRNEDRYLFLETLLSARTQFVITYTGMSVQDNSKLPCSGVVNELCDTIDQSFLFDAGFQYHNYHSLHPFHERNFKPQPFSFSKNNFQIARALRKKISEKPLFFHPENKHHQPIEPLAVSIDEFILFFKNPLQYFLKNNSGLKLSEIESLTLEREPFKITGLDQYSLGSYLVETEKSTFPVSDPYPIIEGKGVLPFGTKGRLEFQRIKSLAHPMSKSAENLRNRNKLPSITGKIEIGNLIVSFTLSGIYDGGKYIVDFGRLNAPRLLSAWIEHLFLNAIAPKNFPNETTLIGQDPDGRKPISSFRFEPIKDSANKFLDSLADCFVKGQQAPFFFFPNTSWQFITFLNKHKFDLSDEILDQARLKSLDAWYGNRYKTGESTNRYLSYFIENNDPFNNLDKLKASGFIDNTLSLFSPMLEHLRRIK